MMKDPEGKLRENSRKNPNNDLLRSSLLDYLWEEGKIVIVAGIPFVRIPAGTFLMGESEEGRYLDEEPVHEVEITQPFYMGMYQVTQEQYERVKGKNPSVFSGVKDLDTRHFPVESVSWYDAEAFCEKLSKSEGYLFRLPTEAEWEYACRGGTTTRFHFGDRISSTINLVNCDNRRFAGHSQYGYYLGRPACVGSYPPNAFGLYDMHGNVWEWCSDWFEEDYYSRSPKRDPKGPQSGEYRVLRGGSWLSQPLNCRAAFRYWGDAPRRLDLVGFRVVFTEE